MEPLNYPNFRSMIKYLKFTGEDLTQLGKFVLTPGKTARVLKSFVGSCIWLFQTRYGILFEVCSLASNIIVARSPIEDMKIFINDAKAVNKKIMGNHMPLKYFTPPIGGGNRRPQLITFCDA